jgi:hypothetical protein
MGVVKLQDPFFASISGQAGKGGQAGKQQGNLEKTCHHGLLGMGSN